MKFLIRKNYKKEKFIKGVPVYGTGQEYHSVYEDILYAKKVSKDKVKFRTGLTEHDLKSSPVLLDDLKEVYISKLPQARERIQGVYGDEALDDTNEVFWNKQGHISVSKDMLNTVFDDETDVNALILKYNIAAGGFSDIAPSLECALASSKKYYLVEQEELNSENFEESVNLKLKANAALNDLYEKGSSDGLLYISWVLLSETQGFTRNNSKEVIVESLSEYLEGKLVNKDKKACAKRFIEYAQMWKKDKESLIKEAVFNAGIYYGIIVLVEGKFMTKNGTTLGGNKQLALKNLGDLKNIEELKALKEEIDTRLNK